MHHDQPLPDKILTLQDLYKELDCIDTMLHDSLTTGKLEIREDNIIDARTSLRTILSIVAKKVNQYESISPATNTTKEQEVIAKAVKQEKPMFFVSGVQLIENGILQGTSLYSTMVKAKGIRDILNRKYAELKVNHEAKIIQYPVF